MPKGTVMYFASDGTQAHIWSSDSASPLFVAHKTDFAEIWSDLSVGTVVKISAFKGGTRQRATALELLKTDA